MILVGGENLIDFIQEKDVEGFPLFRAIPGGSPYNVAKTLALQQVKTGYLTPISNDNLGDLLIEDLPTENLEILAARSPLPTSLAVVSLVNNQPSYQFYRNNTAERDVSAQSLRDAMPGNIDGFYIGSLAITAGQDADIWADAWIASHQRGVFTAIDPNIRPAFIDNRSEYLNRLDKMLQAADLVKLSDEDLSWIAPDVCVIDAAQTLFEDSSASLLVLTLGSKGAVGFTQAGQIRVTAMVVPQLKDTVGAGDTFMGTLLAQIEHRGLLATGALARAGDDTIRQILNKAAKAAAINCGRVGCNPPLLAEL